MSIELAKKLFSVDEYYRMAEAGILGPDDRVELIEGEIIQMSPMGARHGGHIRRMTRLFVTAFAGRASVSPQLPLQLTDYTEPEPDFSILKLRADDYISRKARPEDALLIVEISDTSLIYDRDVKLALYAKAQIPEVWIEDLTRGELLTYSEPAGNSYQRLLVLRPGDVVSPVAFSDIRFNVADFFGDK